MTRLTLFLGDITTQEVDAIVNAANSSLRGGGGVDGAIHDAAGDELYEECASLGGCETGQSKLTKGYKLPAKYVIHTVGPDYGYEDGREAQLLESCYIQSLLLAEKQGIKTIAFPAISVGIFHYPLDQATKIAIETVKEFISQKPDVFDEIRFVAFTEDVYNTYAELIPLGAKSIGDILKGLEELPKKDK
jgi:O-acetyl-ADP-ribose deacetylase